MENEIAGAIVAFFAMFFFVAVILSLAVWVYMSFAYMKIAKKNKQKIPGLAWIPFIGPLIIAYKASKMHWWPWLLFIGYIIPIVNTFAMLILGIFGIIWHWKMFKAIKKPEWFAILMLIPVVNLITIGIAAWKK